MDGFGKAIGVFSMFIGLLFALVWWWGAKAFYKRWREAHVANRDWPRAQAVITALSDKNIGSLTLPTAAYEFVASDGKTYVGTDWEQVATNPQPGSQMEVFYDPQNPTTNYPAGKMVKRIGGWAVMYTLVLLFLAASVAMLFALGFGALFSS